MENFQQLLNAALNTALFMGLFVIALWLVHFMDSVLLKGALRRRFSLRPRARFNLGAILISPFLHVDRKHLAANSIPFFVLGSLVMIQGQVVFWLTTIIIIVTAGMGIWAIGKANSAHMGASGLILGYFGFSLASIFFSPDLATFIVALVVGILYLGLISQIVPLKKGVSTTGHLFGFLGGILAAGASVLLVP